MYFVLLFCISVIITGISIWLGIPFFLFILFFPLIPFMKKRHKKQCTVCGWDTHGDETFCPYDGTLLREI